MAKSTTHNAEQVIEAIRGTGGIKTTIAKRLKVSRWTVDNYLDRWVTVREAYEEECESVTDMAETNLFQEIKDRNFQAIKFYLQTKGMGS
jgi:transposase